MPPDHSIRGHKKKQDVLVKYYAPGSNKGRKANISLKVKVTRSSLVSFVEYACQISSLCQLRFKSHNKG